MFKQALCYVISDEEKEGRWRISVFLQGEQQNFCLTSFISPVFSSSSSLVTFVRKVHELFKKLLIHYYLATMSLMYRMLISPLLTPFLLLPVHQLISLEVELTFWLGHLVESKTIFRMASWTSARWNMLSLMKLTRCWTWDLLSKWKTFCELRTRKVLSVKQIVGHIRNLLVC